MKTADFYKKIKKLFSTKNKKSRFFRDPYHDWGVALGISSAVLLLILLGALYLFYKISTGEFLNKGSAGLSAGETLDRKTLEQTLKYYKDRENKIKEMGGIPAAPATTVATSTTAVDPRE
jgi:hypothetical protein